MKPIKITLLSLVLLNFFGLFSYPFLTYAINAFFIGCFIWDAWINHTILKPFNIALSMILIGFACSIASSFYFEHSDPWKTYIGGQFILSIFYFIFLERLYPEREDVEKALVYLTFIMCTIYIIQFVAFQWDITFLSTRQVTTEEGTDLRLRMNGSALAAFGLFYGLCKLWNKEGNRILNITLSTLGAIVIFLMAFRTMIAGLVLVTLILAAKNMGVTYSSFKNIGLIGLIAIVASNIPIVQEKINYMYTKQSLGYETFTNSDYVRLLNLQYHYGGGYFHNYIERFFGSGIVGTAGTDYADKLQMTADLHMRWVDWGLLGLSWMVGIITVLGMLYYCWKIYRTKFELSNSYIFAFFLYLVIVSITTNEFARPGNFVVQALLLYLAYDIYYERQIEEEEAEEYAEDEVLQIDEAEEIEYEEY